MPDPAPILPESDDKTKHALVGSALYETAADLWPDAHPLVVRVAVPAVAGVAKELLDSQLDGHTVDPMDALGTALGGALTMKRGPATFTPILSDDTIGLDVRLKF